MSAQLSPQDFLTRWQHADGSELANYQLFVADLCRLLGVEARLIAVMVDDPAFVVGGLATVGWRFE